MTSYRLKLLPQIIKNIEQQTLSPERVLIYYSSNSWHLDDGIPEMMIINSFLKIEYICVPNTGSSRKYIHTLEKFRYENKYILFIDDDRTWRPDVFNILFKTIKNYDLGLVTTCGWSTFAMMKIENQKNILRTNNIYSHQVNAKSEVLVASSGWATLVNNNYIDYRLFDKFLQDEFRINETDEIFLSSMIKSKKYVLPINGKCYCDLDTNIHQWKNEKSSDAKLKQLQLLSLIRKIKWSFQNDNFYPNSLLS